MKTLLELAGIVNLKGAAIESTYKTSVSDSKIRYATVEDDCDCEPGTDCDCTESGDCHCTNDNCDDC